MHSYPLHRNIDVECECCRLIQPFNLTSKHDQVICKACVRHVGSSVQKTEQRSRDHLGLWCSEVQMLTEERDELRRSLAEERIAANQTRVQLQGEVDRLTGAIAQGLSDTSPADVQHLMTQKVVQDAEGARDAAYRSRDRIYQLLWHLDGKHRPEDRGGSCVCGQRRCTVLDVIGDDERADLYNWERRNIERSRNLSD